jgi:hypothetical protein
MALVALPNGQLASGSCDNSIKIWDVATGAELRTLGGHEDFVWTVAALPNGQLASGANDNSINIWDVATGAEVRTLGGHEDAVLTLTVLPKASWPAGLRTTAPVCGAHGVRSSGWPKQYRPRVRAPMPWSRARRASTMHRATHHQHTPPVEPR